MTESDFLSLLRGLAAHPGARGFEDDAAVLELGGRSLVLTHDMIVEGVHFLPGDPPEDVAWKLVAVNLSDLAAKGARPAAALLGYALAQDSGWDRAFLAGLESALSAFALPLIGGDTISVPPGAPRTLGLTAIGEAAGPVPSRAGGRAGDRLWVSGSIGDAGLGLEIASGRRQGPEELARRYRRPRPRLEAGEALAPLVSAMMDISDGLLIDSARLAAASGLGARIELDTMPLSESFLSSVGESRAARLAAATAGDDYELLFAASPGASAEILALSERLGLPLSPVGALQAGEGLSVIDRDGLVPQPERLGWEHRPA